MDIKAKLSINIFVDTKYSGKAIRRKQEENKRVKLQQTCKDSQRMENMKAAGDAICWNFMEGSHNNDLNAKMREENRNKRRQILTLQIYLH